MAVFECHHVCVCVYPRTWQCSSVTMFVCVYPRTWQCTSVTMFVCVYPRTWQCTSVTMFVCVFIPRHGSVRVSPCLCVCLSQDNVVYERLEGSHRYSEVTLQHLEQFATLGLRTLCLATADVSQDFYDEWKHTYYKASTSLQNREKKLEEAAELIERVRLHIPLLDKTIQFVYCFKRPLGHTHIYT